MAFEAPTEHTPKLNNVHITENKTRIYEPVPDSFEVDQSEFYAKPPRLYGEELTCNASGLFYDFGNVIVYVDNRRRLFICPSCREQIEKLEKAGYAQRFERNRITGFTLLPDFGNANFTLPNPRLESRFRLRLAIIERMGAVRKSNERQKIQEQLTQIHERFKELEQIFPYYYLVREPEKQIVGLLTNLEKAEEILVFWENAVDLVNYTQRNLEDAILNPQDYETFLNTQHIHMARGKEGGRAYLGVSTYKMKSIEQAGIKRQTAIISTASSYFLREIALLALRYGNDPAWIYALKDTSGIDFQTDEEKKLIRKRQNYGLQYGVGHYYSQNGSVHAYPWCEADEIDSTEEVARLAIKEAFEACRQLNEQKILLVDIPAAERTATEDIKLRELIAKYAYHSLRAHHFPSINNSRVFTTLNIILQRFGYPMICPGYREYYILLTEENFRKEFSKWIDESAEQPFKGKYFTYNQEVERILSQKKGSI